MNKAGVECFVEAARCGSFAKAAAKLFMAQQTVGRHVAMLESELKASLLERTPAGVRLTEVGSYYYTFFQSRNHNFELTKERIARRYDELNSAVRLGCSDWLNPVPELYDVIASFQRGHEGIRLSVRIFDNDDLYTGLLDGELDVALFSEAHVPLNKDIEAVPLCREDLCLVGPDSVIGPGLPDEQRALRGALTFLIVPGRNQSHTETMVFGQRELQRLGMPNAGIRFMPNVASQTLAMEQMKYLAFSDRRFGFLNDRAGLGCESIGVESSIMCCTPLQTENGNVKGFIEHMRRELRALAP
jgi:DNA-binding transcriptional LysR family regulator